MDLVCLIASLQWPATQPRSIHLLPHAHANGRLVRSSYLIASSQIWRANWSLPYSKWFMALEENSVSQILPASITRATSTQLFWLWLSRSDPTLVPYLSASARVKHVTVGKWGNQYTKRTLVSTGIFSVLFRKKKWEHNWLASGGVNYIFSTN